MTLKFLALQGAPCIYVISRLRVNRKQVTDIENYFEAHLENGCTPLGHS
jgi:hypothetical protein